MNGKDVLVSVENLTAGYGKQNIFENLSFNIRENEVFGLIGLNGAGKTTLIKTMLGLRAPSSGDVIFHGLSGNFKSHTSYLPERFDPPWFLSGYEFLKFSLSLYKKNISYDEAVDAANSVSLNPNFLKKKVQSYSKGMRQKLGLLATVLIKCPLLILDEPMSGLDPKARFEVKSLIHDVKNEGHSVFMSSHILSDIAELCDRVALFHEGEFIFLGTPEEMDAVGKGSSLEESFLNLINANKMVA